MPDLERQYQGLGKRPGLLLVDMSRGFIDPACPVGSPAEGVVVACRELLAAFRERKLPVFFTTVVYRDDRQARVFRNRLPALNVLTADSEWVLIDPRLAPRSDEPVIEKQWASGFFQSRLQQELKKRHVDSLVIGGLTTSGCVRATAVDGLQHDYPVVVVREAVGDRNPEAHAASLFDLGAKYADVLKLKEVKKLISTL